MTQQTNYFPADFYDDFNEESFSSQRKFKRQERMIKNVASSNKIHWQEKYDWILTREESIDFDDIKRNFSNSKSFIAN